MNRRAFLFGATALATTAAATIARPAILAAPALDSQAAIRALIDAKIKRVHQTMADAFWSQAFGDAPGGLGQLITHHDAEEAAPAFYEESAPVPRYVYHQLAHRVTYDK